MAPPINAYLDLNRIWKIKVDGEISDLEDWRFKIRIDLDMEQLWFPGKISIGPKEIQVVISLGQAEYKNVATALFGIRRIEDNWHIHYLLGTKMHFSLKGGEYRMKLADVW